MNSNDEKELITESIKGNRQAFSELVRLNVDKIYGLCLNLTKNSLEAEDLAQDVFLKALKGIKNYKEKSSFSTWLYRITLNLWIDKCRRNKIIKFFSFSSIKNSVDDHIIEIAVDFSSENKDSENEELKEKLNKVIDKLPEQEKIVIILKMFENKSYEDIARICKCTIGTVGSRLSRALKKLRQYLKN